ncbi:MAG TPA: hypothetical protein VFX21_10985, partial [Acidimicrobiia bacterium]|nr:hypothetical protein [Acidimicrobiia bacterium]
MAKKKAGEEDEDGGGSAKGLIIKVVVALVVGAFVAKTFFLKPPPPTEAALKAKAKGEFVDMAFKCAASNEVAYDAAAVDAEFEHLYEEEHAAAPTTVAAAAEAPAEAPQFAGEVGGGGLGMKLASARPASGGAEGAVATGPALLEVDATT